MARPTRTNAEYFYHPATFRNDRRVKAIRARYGACGYGLLLMLIELLTDADNTALPTDEMEIELLAGDLSSTVEDVTNLIQAAEKVGLFGRNAAGMLKCPQLDEWLAPVFDKRNRARNTPTPPKLSQPVTETPITVTETPPVKESTGENSTEQESKDVLTPSSLRSEDAATAAAGGQEKKIGLVEASFESPAPKKPPVAATPRFVPPTEAMVLTYMLSQRPDNPGPIAGEAERWLGYYQSNGWKVGRNPMKDWQAACRNWLGKVPKQGPAGLSQAMVLPIQQQQPYGNSTGYRPQHASQVTIRTNAIAQADAMVDAMASTYKPYEL